MPRVTIGTLELLCTGCKQVRKICEFRLYKHIHSINGALLYSNICRECHREEARMHYRSKHLKGLARGERHWHSKITWFDVRILRSNPKISTSALARLLGIHNSKASEIRRGLSWKTQN